MTLCIKLLFGGALATVFGAASPRPSLFHPQDLRATPASLLLIYDAAPAGARLLHASPLPARWREPAANTSTGGRTARVRMIDRVGTTLRTIPCGLPLGGSPVGSCRGPGCADHAATQHDGAAIATLADSSTVTSIVVPDLEGVSELVLEEQHGDHWDVLQHSNATATAAARLAGERLHSAVTYGAAPVQGGGR